MWSCLRIAWIMLNAFAFFNWKRISGEIIGEEQPQQQQSHHHLHHHHHHYSDGGSNTNGGGGELGDSAISDTSRDGIFAALDNDGNGKVTVEELTQYIEGTGGNSLDEVNEIQSAVSSTMSFLDDNNDNVLKKDDLSKYWSSLGSVLSVEEVTDWVAYAQLMPPNVVQSFLDNAITGYDFPELLENDGRLLETELGMTRPTTRRRLVRGMKMKLFGMGSPPPLAHVPVVHLSEQTLCYTNIQIQWDPVVLNSVDENAVYPVHLYRLQRQEQISPTDRSSASPSSYLSSSSSVKWITVYVGQELTTFDKIYTPPIRIIDENNSGGGGGGSATAGPGQVISVTYRLSSWNVIGRSDYSYLKYDITRPTINSWSSLYGADECSDQTFPLPQTHLSTADLELMVLKMSELANSSPTSQLTQNISPSLTIHLTPDQDPQISASSSSNSWSISSFFASIWYILWILWTIYSTGRAWLWTFLSILSLPITLIYLYLRFNPPPVDPTGASAQHSHWLQSSLMKQLISSVCTVLIHCTNYLSQKFPSSKSALQSFTQFLESIQSQYSHSPSIRIDTLTTTTLRQHRILRRMNSARSAGDESADSQNSGNEDGKSYSSGDKCYLCAKQFKFRVSLSKINWRVKHHCHICFNSFCSKCGVVAHSNPSCPVRGTCCCQRCYEDKRQRHENSSPAGVATAGVATASEGAMRCDHHGPHCDETNLTSTTSGLDFDQNNHINNGAQDQNTPLVEKKKNKSFASLKDFGINFGRKTEKEKEKMKITCQESPIPGIPPRPTPPSSSSKKLQWPSIPSLGRRVTSSPPAIHSDRSHSSTSSNSSSPPPPELSTSSSWPIVDMSDHISDEFI